MYSFYETNCYKTNTFLTRTVCWITNKVTVLTSKGKPKRYIRTRVREAILKQYRIGIWGRELAGVKVKNYALGIYIQKGNYWPEEQS